jgi:hypothetical protein
MDEADEARSALRTRWMSPALPVRGQDTDRQAWRPIRHAYCAPRNGLAHEVGIKSGRVPALNGHSSIQLADRSSNATQLLLTKGDTNAVDDIALYRGPEWLDSKYVIGKVQG